MSDPQRREFLAGPQALASLAALGGALPAAGRRPELHEQRPRPAARRQGAADLQVRAGEVGGQGHRQQLRQGGDRQATADLQGDRRRLDAARARARCASCTGTPPRPSGRSSSRAASAPRSSTRRATPRPTTSSPGDVWYFPRGHGHMLAVPRRQAVPLHPDLRQRLLLRVRHLQHHRLDRPHAQGAAGQELRPARGGLRRRSRRRRCTSPAGQSPPEKPAPPLQGWKLPPETHKYRLLAQPPHASIKGGREWRVDSSRFPISKTITGVVLDLEPGRAAELHWHPNADEWQYVIEGEVSVTLFGSHGRYRIETLEKGDVGYIPQGYGHSIENVGDEAAPRPDRVQHRRLRGDRPVAVDRGNPAGRAGHQLRPAGGAVREVPAIAMCSSPARTAA